MARAQFQKGQKVWVESVGAWAEVEKINAIWAKGFDEPVRVSYDVGLGRDFQAAELLLPIEDGTEANLGAWRLLRARNKWQEPVDTTHHPAPGTYPVVVTDSADWGGWRVPGAEYDRDPHRIEYQARLIAAAPRFMVIAEALVAAADEELELPGSLMAAADRARDVLRGVKEILAVPADESAVARRARESAPLGSAAPTGSMETVAAETRIRAA